MMHSCSIVWAGVAGTVHVSIVTRHQALLYLQLVFACLQLNVDKRAKLLDLIKTDLGRDGINMDLQLTHQNKIGPEAPIAR